MKYSHIQIGYGTICVSNKKSLCRILDASFDKKSDVIIPTLEQTYQYVTIDIRTNKIIALLSLKKKGQDHNGKTHNNMIYNVCTLPTYRRKGIMSSLFEYVINNLKSKKQRVIYLEVLYSNQKALRLYEKLGFKKIDVTNVGYVMKLSLKKMVSCTKVK